MVDKMRIQFNPERQQDFERFTKEALFFTANNFSNKYEFGKIINIKNQLKPNLMRSISGGIFIENLNMSIRIELAQKFIERLEFLTGCSNTSFQIVKDFFLIIFE